MWPTYLTEVTQSMPDVRWGSRSPWAKATNHQPIPKSNQLQRNVIVKITKVNRHLRSTKVVKTSWRNRPCSRMFLCARLQAPFFAMKRALLIRSLKTGFRGKRDTSAGRANSSGIMLFRASILTKIYHAAVRQTSVTKYSTPIINKAITGYKLVEKNFTHWQ